MTHLLVFFFSFPYLPRGVLPQGVFRHCRRSRKAEAPISQVRYYIISPRLDPTTLAVPQALENV